MLFFTPGELKCLTYRLRSPCSNSSEIQPSLVAGSTSQSYINQINPHFPSEGGRGWVEEPSPSCVRGTPPARPSEPCVSALHPLSTALSASPALSQPSLGQRGELSPPLATELSHRALVSGLFKKREPVGGSKAIIMTSFSRTLHVCTGSGLACSINCWVNEQTKGSYTVICSYHAAKFFLKALASGLGKPGRPSLHLAPRTVILPDVTVSSISFQ